MHRPNSKKEPWYILAKPGTTESLVYLACWRPRTQNEVIRWIYGRFPTNIRPVIRARRAIKKLGYLKVTRDSDDQRKMTLFSKAEPFISYAETQLTTTTRPIKGKQSLSDDERGVLLKILDSNWFRQSFSGNLEHRRLDLDVQSGLGALAEFLEEVCAMSEVLAIYPYLKQKMPSVTTVLECKTFDAFMKEWSAAKIEPEPMIPKSLAMVAASVRQQWPADKRMDLLLENTLDHPPFPPLCVPSSLAHKLSTIGRVPLTLAMSLVEALKEERQSLLALP